MFKIASTFTLDFFSRSLKELSEISNISKSRYKLA